MTLVTTVSEGIKSFAKAIASAEGFWVPGSIPAKAHNPGDLVLGDKGHGTLGPEGITVFGSDDEGWAALYHELVLIQTGASHVYQPTMTIAQIACHWTATQQKEWAQNVARWYVRQGQLDVTVNTPFRRLMFLSGGGGS